MRLLDRRLDAAADWSASKMSTVEIVVDRAAACISDLRVVPKDHPWFGTNIDAQSPFDLDRLAPILDAAIAKLDTFNNLTKKVVAAIADIGAPSIVDAVSTALAKAASIDGAVAAKLLEMPH